MTENITPIRTIRWDWDCWIFIHEIQFYFRFLSLLISCFTLLLQTENFLGSAELLGQRRVKACLVYCL